MTLNTFKCNFLTPLCDITRLRVGTLLGRRPLHFKGLSVRVTKAFGPDTSSGALLLKCTSHGSLFVGAVIQTENSIVIC